MNEWIRMLAASTQEFAQVLDTGDPEAAVPACPGWTLAELGEHLGGVHQWATHAITHGTPDGEATPAPRGRAYLAQWYRDSAAQLLDALTTTPLDAPVWTFGPHPRTAEFWGRRQVHEVDMHLWDAHASQGQGHALDPQRALDAIDEALTVFFPRQVRLGRTPALTGTMALEASNPGGPGWPARTPVVGRFLIGGDGTTRSPDPAATVSGPPDALLLLLWKRIGPDDVRVQVTGDTEWATAALRQALTP